VKYPLIASATYPAVGESDLADPAQQYRLHADADQTKTHASATLRGGSEGLSVVEATTDTSIEVVGGKATAHADSRLNGVSVAGGLVKISSVHAVSTTTPAGDGKPVTDAELHVEGATVSGQVVTIDTAGVHAGPANVPADLQDQSTAQALEAAGVRLRIVHPEKLEGGGSSDALEVTWVQSFPAPGPPSATVTYAIGGASTAIFSGEGRPDTAAAGDLTVPDELPPPSGATGEGTSGAVVPVPAAAAPSAVVGLRGAKHVSRSLLDLGRAFRLFYLAIALGGALGLITGAAWDVIGVRGMVNRRWS
jgi:hypothetical protein